MRKPGIVGLAAALLAAACTGPTGSATTGRGTEAPAATTSPLPAPSTTAASTPETVPTGLQPPRACLLTERAEGNVGLSFPRHPARLRSEGEVHIAVLFADFPDAAADRTAAEAFEIVSPTTEEFFAAVSYGRMGMSLHPHLEWLRMGGGSERHFAAIRSFEGQRDFIQSAVRLADPRFDFSGMDAVVVITAPNASLIRYGPAWLGFEAAGGRIEADGHTMTNGATSGADLTMWGWAWLAHEIGHTLGLPDLYDREGGGFTRPFGVMDHIAGSAPEFFAYERWHVGWIDSDQIACVESEATVTLSAVERPGGTKAAMVPLDRGRAVVVESRRAVGFDERLSREGALVYTVDTSIETFEGPIRVKHPRRALLEGESITLEGVAVRVLEATADGDTVLVSVEPGG